MQSRRVTFNAPPIPILAPGSLLSIYLFICTYILSYIDVYTYIYYDLIYIYIYMYIYIYVYIYYYYFHIYIIYIVYLHIQYIVYHILYFCIFVYIPMVQLNDQYSRFRDGGILSSMLLPESRHVPRLRRCFQHDVTQNH